MLSPIRLSVHGIAFVDNLTMRPRKEEVDILKDVNSAGLLPSKYVYTKIEIYAPGPGLERGSDAICSDPSGRGLRFRDTPESWRKSPGPLDKSHVIVFHPTYRIYIII